MEWRTALLQLACFDTAFNRSMPTVARRLPIPRGLHSMGIERYGSRQGMPEIRDWKWVQTAA